HVPLTAIQLIRDLRRRIDREKRERKDGVGCAPETFHARDVERERGPIERNQPADVQIPLAPWIGVIEQIESQIALENGPVETEVIPAESVLPLWSTISLFVSVVVGVLEPDDAVRHR